MENLFYLKFLLLFWKQFSTIKISFSFYHFSLIHFFLLYNYCSFVCVCLCLSMHLGKMIWSFSCFLRQSYSFNWWKRIFYYGSTLKEATSKERKINFVLSSEKIKVRKVFVIFSCFFFSSSAFILMHVIRFLN